MMPIELMLPQHSACSSAARSGRSFERSATEASIITSGIAKLRLQLIKTSATKKGEVIAGAKVM